MVRRTRRSTNQDYSRLLDTLKPARREATALQASLPIMGDSYTLLSRLTQAMDRVAEHATGDMDLLKMQLVTPSDTQRPKP